MMKQTRSAASRGFTLIEMLVALAVSGLITAAALSAFVQVSRATRRAEQQAHADEEAKLLVDYVMTQVQQAGGGQVRPWMGVAVDDNTDITQCGSTKAIGTATAPACGGADRMHVTVLPNAPQCTITSVAGSTVTVPSAGACCLTVADFQNKPVVLFSQDGGPKQGEWRSSFCTSVDIATCKCTLAASDTAYTTPSHADPDFAGGIIAPGTTWSFYVDNAGVNAANPILKVVADDGTGHTAVTELQDHIQDLQIDLGFDTDGDQIVDRFQPLYTGAPVTARSQLRQLRVGIIVGEPVAARDTSSQAQLSNGPVRSAARGMYMRSTTSTTTLRNLNIFF